MDIIAWYKGNAVIIRPATAESLGIKRGHVIMSDDELHSIIGINAMDAPSEIYNEIRVEASMTPQEIKSRTEMLESIDHPKSQP